MNLPDIVVRGNQVTIPSMRLDEGHRWFSELILDGKLPLWAPIGMLFKPQTGNTNGDITVRNNTFMEAPLSMLSNISNTLFIGLHAPAATVVCPPEEGIIGRLSFQTMPLKELRTVEMQAVRALSTDTYFAYALEKVAIHFYCKMETGYRTMSKNAQTIMASQLDPMSKGCYLPVASNHTLNNYLRVCALTQNAIQVQYLNGFTPDMLIQVWEEARKYGG